MDVADLVEIEQIRRLKHDYVRLMDTKQWDALALLLADDATASWGGGAWTYEGRDAIMGFLLGSAGSERFITMHLVGEPSILVDGPDEAHGTWPLRDEVVMLDEDTVVRGYAYYEDRFVKRDGTWLISHSGYRRIYEETFPMSAIAGRRVTATLWETGGRSTLFDE